MAKNKRNKRTSKGKARGKDLKHYSVRLDFETGAAKTFELPKGARHVLNRYINRHDRIPLLLDRWSVDKLERRVGPLIASGREEDLQRAMIILAHHRSEHAAEKLRGMRDQVPAGDLFRFWELAYDEALGWLGFDYFPDVEKEGQAAACAPS